MADRPPPGASFGADFEMQALHRPQDWDEAIRSILRSDLHRIAVVGPTDAGKSSFIRALIEEEGSQGREIVLLDADPGQKMIGPPGTVTLSDPRPDRAFQIAALRFIGTTSASARRALVEATWELAKAAGDARLVVNTSGFVHGLGLTILKNLLLALRPQSVVALAPDRDLLEMLGSLAVETLRLSSSPAARKKTAGERGRIRRAAFRDYLAAAERVRIPCSGDRVEVPAVCLLLRDARPVCGITSVDGRDLAIGVLTDIAPGTATVFCPRPPARPAGIRLGSMWARSTRDGWKLLDRLFPARPRDV